MWNNTFGDVGGLMDTSDTTSKSQNHQTERLQQNVIPLVVGQILNSTTEKFTLFDLPVYIVSLVGILRKFEIQSTKATCTVEDFSGSINAILWLEMGNDFELVIPEVKLNNYVQIFGTIRYQDGEKFIMILKIIPVDDCNIITTHLLQFLVTRFEAEAMSTKIIIDKPSTSSISNLASFTFTSGLKPLERQVFQILTTTPEGVNGINKDNIMKYFKSDQEQEVKEVLNLFYWKDTFIQPLLMIIFS